MILEAMQRGVIAWNISPLKFKMGITDKRYGVHAKIFNRNLSYF